MKYLLNILLILFLIGCSSFKTSSQEKEISKKNLDNEDYEIINVLIDSFLLQEICAENSVIILSDSTSNGRQLMSISWKERKQNINDSLLLFLLKTHNEINNEKEVVNFDYLIVDNDSIIGNYSNKYINKETKTDYYWEQIQIDFPNFCSIIKFTKPVISNQFAVAYIEYFSGKLNGAGYLFILKKETEGWSILFKQRKWVS